jgi:hypothetical protein
VTHALVTTEDPAYKEILKRAGGSDVYFWPEYSACYEGISEGQTELFVFEDGGDIFIFPFRRRKIPFSGFEYWDITSEYGYGGPLTTSISERFLSKAYETMEEWAASEYIVAEFCRYHPLLQNANIAQSFRTVKLCNRTVWIPTESVPEKVFLQMKSNVRRKYRKALRDGVQIRFGTIGKDVDTFHRIYTETMKHVGASDFYLFPPEFFKRHLYLLNGNCFLLLAELDGIEVAGGLFFFGPKYLHYHFGATNRTHPNAAKANGMTVLFCEAIRIASKKGLKGLHLGGGVGGENDSLMRFKGEFSTHRADFYTSGHVFLPEIYTEICRGVSVDAEKVSFFPAYRVELL